MVWRGFRYLHGMGSVLWTLARDLLCEDLSWEEVRTNYLLGKAHAYDRAHILSRAVRTYEKILEKDPARISVYLNLGGLYYRRGRIEEAITQYEKVVSINRKHYQGHYWLAMCYWRQKRYYAAINVLEEVIDLLPTFRDALNLMGECYEQIGEGAKAEHFYLKAMRADPCGFVVHGGLLNRANPDGRTEARMKH